MRLIFVFNTGEIFIIAITKVFHLIKLFTNFCTSGSLPGLLNCIGGAMVSGWVRVLVG